MSKVVWQPRQPETTSMWMFMKRISEQYRQPFSDYHELHRWSINNLALFWQELCEFFHIEFDTPPKTILNDYSHMMEADWFEGATLNYAKALLKRDDTHPALIELNEQGTRDVISYRDLKQHVARCALGLKQAGVCKGTRVAAILPNTAYTIIAFLATASIGAIWASCSPDFGVQSAVDRLGQIEPMVLFISDGHQYQGKKHDFLNKAHELLTLMPSITTLVVCPNLHESPNIFALKKAIIWRDFIQSTQPLALEFIPVSFNHPLYVLFSSGTTGKPKCIVHRTGGVLIQHIKELGLHTNLQEHDNMLFYTTCGWMMWNWMVSTLTFGATLTLYEGSPTYPSPSHLFELVDKENVSIFGTSAKFLTTVEKNNVYPNQTWSMTHLRCILSTGSPLLPMNYDFVYQHIKQDVQLASISGGTDIVSCFALGNPILPIYRGELQCLGLGMSVEVFNEQGLSVRETRGELVCTKPFPSMPLGFWQDFNHERYRKAYFERFSGIWAHGDMAEITSHNGLIIYGRSDAVLNPGGVRIGTAEIYRQVEKIPEVLDSVVIGQQWQDDVRIVLFVKLRHDLHLDETLISHIKQTIRNHASPRHVPAKILQVKDIPKTINGKTVELAVRQVVHGQPVPNIQSIANPKALDEYKNRKELQHSS